MAVVYETIYDWDAAQADAFFEYAGYKARRVTEPLHDAGDAILESVAEAFETEGMSIGHPWDDLSRTYKKQKEARWGHVYPILVASGRLEAAATSQSAVRVRTSAEGGHLVYQVPVSYADFHQQTEGPDTGKMPHRPFFELTHDLVEHIEQAFIDWLDDLRDANTRRFGPAVNPFEGIL